MKNKKGFTLIELLAIIVILAIIAVITVPIILDMVEESKKGAIKNSAYGYKDAIDKKYYIEQLENSEFQKLNGNYMVNNDGNLSKSSDTFEITVSGQKPSGGLLDYENGVLKNACLAIDGYEAIYQNGAFAVENKGDCSNISFSETCPGPTCVYAFHSEYHAIEGTPAEIEGGYSSTLTNYTSDYTTLNRVSFLAHILESGKIKRSFVCGTQNNEVFCLEGGVDEDSPEYETIETNNEAILANFINTNMGQYSATYQGDTVEIYIGYGETYATWTSNIQMGDPGGICLVDVWGYSYCHDPQ